MRGVCEVLVAGGGPDRLLGHGCPEDQEGHKQRTCETWSEGKRTRRRTAGLDGIRWAQPETNSPPGSIIYILNVHLKLKHMNLYFLNIFI